MVFILKRTASTMSASVCGCRIRNPGGRRDYGGGNNDLATTTWRWQETGESQGMKLTA
ncbi:hypothetical protein MJ561_07235 [Klebsiella pneumoniae]|nr:hypothetical protein MJ561_07235 [Klebsiella pneumoniae]